MKKYNISSLLVKGTFILSSLLMFSCEVEEPTYDTSNPRHETLPESYLQVISGFFPFSPGQATYDFEFNVINGNLEFTEVRMYKTFTDAATGTTAAEVIAATYPVSGYGRTVVEQAFTYTDLASGITVNGNPLPTLDEDVAPGSGWSFRFEATTEEGEVVDVPGAINIIYSKWAGNYEVVSSKYVRTTTIVEDFGGWNGNVVFIGYVDDNTLSYNDNWGYFAWGGNAFHIDFDETTLEITDVPVITADGLFSGDREIKCGPDDSKFASLDAQLGFNACDNGNFIEEDVVNGNHEITLVYGYITGSDPRQFYEVLRKL